jgi:FkbM family methyltransferase
MTSVRTMGRVVRVPRWIAFLVPFALMLSSQRYYIEGADGCTKSSVNKMDIISGSNVSPDSRSSIVLKSSGDGWKVWETDSPIIKHGNYTCAWTKFTSTNGLTAPMCVHSSVDAVSGSIVGIGRWPDCDELTDLWNSNITRIKRKNADTVYIEIGANIGSCVMHMLLTTNASIYAFEPHPKNQHCLTSTLSHPDNVGFAKRVHLFPIGLGLQTDKSVIHSAKGNMGNSVVGDKFVKDSSDQVLDEKISIPIAIERLDDVLSIPQSTRVSLMKMDAQGFECYIIRGMPNVLTSTDTIKAEIATKWLNNFDGCSAQIIMDGNQRLDGPPRENTVYDIVANKKAL